MEFNNKTDLLIKDLIKSSGIIGESISAPQSFVERMMVQGCFMLIAHCKEQHGVDVPISVDELLAHSIGQAGLDAAKKYCEDNGETSLVSVLATPVNPRDIDA